MPDFYVLLSVLVTAVCFIPICHQIAEKVDAKTSLWVMIALVAVAIPLGYLTWTDLAPEPNPSTIRHCGLFLIVLMAALGLFFGRDTRLRREENIRLISEWEKQLAENTKAGLSPIILAFSLKQMGNIFFNQLKEYDKSVEAYDRAYELMRDNVPADHPYHAHFLWRYSQALRKVGRKEDAVKFDAIRLQIPKIFTAPPGSPAAEGMVLD